MLTVLQNARAELYTLDIDNLDNLTDSQKLQCYHEFKHIQNKLEEFSEFV